MTSVHYPPIVKALFPMSHEQKDVEEMLLEWDLLHREVSDDVRHCPCGTSIKELCWIVNRTTNTEIFIGNECIKHITDEMPFCARCLIQPVISLKAHYCYGCAHQGGRVRIGKHKGTEYVDMWERHRAYCNWLPDTFSDYSFGLFVRTMRAREGLKKNVSSINNERPCPRAD